MEDKISLITKRKNIQLALDYGMDHAIEFTVSPREMGIEEFEIILKISNIKQAVALGMFAKEHKFEVLGLGEMAKQKTNVNATRKSELKEASANMLTEQKHSEQQTPVLNF
jgi:hypothetical protein